MAEGDWRDMWERASDGESQETDRVPVAQLLARVRSGQWGDYYSIWRSIGARARLEEAGWTLYGVLELNADYLHRYHCAAALLALMRENRYEAVDLSAEWGRGRNLPEIQRLLEERIGPRV